MTDKIKAFWKSLEGKKSYLISFVAILYAVVIVGWQQNQWSEAGQLVLGALGLSALRNAK